MKLSLCLAVCAVLAASTAMAVETGTIETGGNLDLHLSPSPWALGADMYLLYYMKSVLGIGPYWSFAKSGSYDVGPYKYEPATRYSIGAEGKLYLPMAYMNGKLTPFVGAGLGLTSVDNGWTQSGFDYKGQTETKAEFMGRVGFDYWLTDKWTVWCAYQADKVFVTGSDWDSNIKVGIATFLVK